MLLQWRLLREMSVLTFGPKLSVIGELCPMTSYRASPLPLFCHRWVIRQALLRSAALRPMPVALWHHDMHRCAGRTSNVTSRPPLPTEDTVTRLPRNAKIASGKTIIRLNSVRRILPAFGSTPDSSVADLSRGLLPR